MERNKEIDLLDTLTMDTILMVKYGLKWCHYNIPISKSNGRPRTYGELYLFYTNKPDFKMAKGYVRLEHGNCWKWVHQYFYFDKKTLPRFDGRILNKPFIMSKSYIKSPKVIKRQI